MLRGPLKKRSTFEVIFSPFARGFAPLALALSVVLPPDGLGFDICWIHRMFGVPCPACGLTRSVTSLTHGRFQQAVVYHPFGPVLYVMLVCAGLYAILPPRVRERLALRAAESERAWRIGYRLFLATFFGFGLLRALAHEVTGTPF